MSRQDGQNQRVVLGVKRVRVPVISLRCQIDNHPGGQCPLMMDADTNPLGQFAFRFETAIGCRRASGIRIIKDYPGIIPLDYGD